MKEYNLLKKTAIEEKVIANSGLSVDQLLAYQKEESEKAIARLTELNLPSPWIKSHPNVTELGRESAARAYRLINSEGKGFSKEPNPITVFCSIGVKSDNKLWLHVSFSAPKFPNYSDFVLVKNIFIGEDNTAIQIFPASKNHVNDHKNCLHLWRCLEDDPLPDFRVFGTI